MTTAAPAAEKKDVRPITKTAYHVLKRTEIEDGQNDYRLVASHVSAVNAEAAIRYFVGSINTTSDKEGEFVAVPSRSWKPTVVKVETQTVIRIGGDT
jgi:hypothetical protein